MQRPIGERTGAKFEREVHDLLDKELPFCVLPNVTLFRPDEFRAEEPDLGEDRINSRAYELDNVFHYRQNESDVVVIIETKALPITAEENRWTYVRYSEGGRDRKIDARDQLVNHAQTILRYLRPVGRHTLLKVEAYVVTTLCKPAIVHSQEHSENIRLHLCGVEQLVELIREIKRSATNQRANVQLLRIAQSEFMTLLRLGNPIKSLGHPELRHAIQYIARCRRDIDHELYRSFSPSKNRWAINGTAGMGKSVLLAYATAVLSCNRRLVFDTDGAHLDGFDERSTEIGLKDLSRRYICAYAMKAKQRDVLEREYLRFFREFSMAAGREEIHFIKPRFDVWKDERAIPAECSVLVVDESHDLSATGQKMIREWHERSTEHYLILACDRHQKIRLADGNATIIEGMSFSGCTKKLGRNYRNPFAINATALGLMYRWFAVEGAKVLPSKREFKELLGFEVAAEHSGSAWRVSMKDDAHPGNLWSHCVGSFPSCAAAYAHLAQQNLSSSEVLWVRFSEEDSDFDYELLSRFTYHNFHTPESETLVDKYVKGQEVPVLVIEGFPDVIETGGRGEKSGELTEDERDMWAFRRQVYICASRATAFLYFIFDVPETDPAKRFGVELSNLLSALSTSSNTKASGSKEWSFEVKRTAVTRRPSIFEDLEEDASASKIEAGSKRDPSIRMATPTSADLRSQALTRNHSGVPRIGAGRQAPVRDDTRAAPASARSNNVVRTPPSKAVRRTVRLRHPIFVGELAREIGESIPSLVSKLQEIGIAVNKRTVLTSSDIQAINERFDVRIEGVH
jgi:hypothetical protein